MAKNRMVSTGFWSDYYVADLDPVEKLLFLYLLTCERSTLAGIYELPIKMMAVETGIDVFMVEKILRRFEDEGKVKYQAGWVAIRNFLKHHEHGSPTVKKGIEDALYRAPEWAQGYIKGIDTLSPSSSALASSSVSAPREEPVIEEEENPKAKKVSTAKYPHSKEVFALFPETYDPEWTQNTTQLRSAEAIYTKATKEDSFSDFADCYNKHKNHEFCPATDSPYEMNMKWPKLDRHLTDCDL